VEELVGSASARARLRCQKSVLAGRETLDSGRSRAAEASGKPG